MQDFCCGFAQTDITPELGIRLGGYPLEDRPAESVHDNLFSSALLFEQESIRYAIISLDWLCITADTANYIKKEINKDAAVPVDNIIICTTHSHTAPNTVGIPGWGDIEQGYVDSVIPLIIKSASIATENLAPAKIGVGTVQSKAGVNRRTLLDDGSVSFAGNPNGTYDPTMTVMRFVDMVGSPIVTLIHYGSHNTAWGPQRVISRDWSGIMVDRVQQQTVSYVAFLNGAIGDVGPRTNKVVGEGLFSAGAGDGLESVLEVGYRAATDALQCYYNITEFDDKPIVRAVISDIDVPVKPLPLLDDVKARLGELDEFKNSWGENKCRYEYYRRVLNAHSQTPVKSTSIESRILVIGPIAFISLPGEPFSSIALRMRKASPFEYTLLISNSNGCIGYIPDKTARKIGGYEIDMESAINTYLPIEKDDDILVDTITRQLRLLKNTKGLDNG